MLKELFSNRLFIGALAFFILCVVGGTLYISHVEKQGAEKLATDEDPVKQPTEKQQQPTETAEAQKSETSQGGHFHNDGTFHVGPHETPPIPATHPTDRLTPDETTDSLAAAEKEELYRILRTEGFNRERLSEKQLLYLSKVGLHWDYLSPEQQRQLDVEYYAQFGLNPPPEGHRYSFQDVSKGILNLDEEGNAIIVKIDDPLIKKSFGGHLLDVSK